MEDKQTRLLTWLSVILLALVALIVFVEPPKEGADEEGELSWERLFPDAKAENATKIELQRGGETVVMVKEGEDWALSSGARSGLRGDARKIGSLLEDVLLAETSALDGDQGDLAAFGLAPPVAVVTVSTSDGASLALRVGRDTPVGYGTYVQKAEGGPVLRARTRLSGAVGGGPGLDDLRDKTLIDLSAGELGTIGIRRAAPPCASGAPDCLPAPSPITLARDEHGWWLREPAAARADGDRVDALLSALSDLRAEGFAPDPGAAFAGELELALGVGDQTKTLVFGADQGGRLVRTPLQPDLARLIAPLPEALTADAAAWRSSALLPVRATTLARLEITLGAETLSAERVDGAWSSPAAETALEALEAVRVDRNAAAPAPSGEAWGSVTLSEEPARQEIVKIYQALPDGGRVAVEPAGGAPFALPATEIARLVESLKVAPQ